MAATIPLLSVVDATPDPPDEILLDALSKGDTRAFERLMRRHNQRLFRISRAILRNDAEAEDALQDAYLHAYRHAGQFRGESRVGTWLARIVINASLMRLRHRRARHEAPAATLTVDNGGPADDRLEPAHLTVLRREVRRALERHVDALPPRFRMVFVLRDIEELSSEETARLLGLTETTVRTRLFRARARLRAALTRELDGAVGDLFGFAGTRCDRIVTRVLARLHDA